MEELFLFYPQRPFSRSLFCTAAINFPKNRDAFSKKRNEIELKNTQIKKNLDKKEILINLRLIPFLSVFKTKTAVFSAFASWSFEMKIL